MKMLDGAIGEMIFVSGGPPHSKEGSLFML